MFYLLIFRVSFLVDDIIVFGLKQKFTFIKNKSVQEVL